MAGTDRNRVLWSEGLFLRAQHLQQQDRFAEGLMRAALQTGPFQPWGFATLKLDAAALEAGRIAVELAAGLLPDGTPFAIPETADPPEPLAVTAETPSGLVHLALPLEQAGTVAFARAHEPAGGARNRGRVVPVRDAADGSAEAEEIEIARPALRLLGPRDGTGGYAALAVAAPAGLKADGSVALDPAFLPPALRIGAAPLYGQWLREILAGLERIAGAHGEVVAGGSGRSVENLLILELANRAHPAIRHLETQDLVHPAALYGELAALAGQMSTYGSGSRRMDELPVYDHALPGPPFGALMDTLRSLMLTLGHVEARAFPLPCARHDTNIWKVRIDNPELLASCRIVVRVRADMSEEATRRLFSEQATVGSAAEFDDLWRARLPGIPLKPLLSHPREIPYDPDRVCLELDRRSPRWATLESSPGFVIGVSGRLPGEPSVDVHAVRR